MRCTPESRRSSTSCSATLVAIRLSFPWCAVLYRVGQLSEPVSQACILRVVHRAGDHRHSFVGECLLQSRAQFLRRADTVTFRPEALGVGHEVRVVEGDLSVVPEFHVHLPLDKTVGVVLPDEDSNWDVLSHGCFDLLRVHHEGPVPNRGQHPALRPSQFRCNGARKREGHSREPVRDQAGIRCVGRVEPRHPHLHRSRVGECDIRIPEHRPCVRHDSLGPQGEMVVATVHLFFEEIAYPLVGEPGVEVPVDRGAQSFQRFGYISLHTDRDVVVYVHLRREAVDVDDLLVALRVDALRIELLQLVPDGDNRIRRVEAKVHVIVGHEPYRTESDLVFVWEDAFAVECRRHRQRERLRESDERVLRLGACGPVPGKDYGLLCRGENLGGTGDLRGRRILGADYVHGKRSEVTSDSRFHILWDGEVSRSRSLSLGGLERLADNLRNRLWAENVVGPFGHRPEHGDEVDALVGLFVDPVQPDLSRQGDQWRAVSGSVGRPEEEVDRPWPERRRAYPGLSCETAVDLGHERRGLLVTDEDVSDLRAVQSVHKVYIFLTWDAEDVLYTFVIQTTHDQLRSRLPRGIPLLSHAASPFTGYSGTTSLRGPSRGLRPCLWALPSCRTAPRVESPFLFHHRKDTSFAPAPRVLQSTCLTSVQDHYEGLDQSDEHSTEVPHDTGSGLRGPRGICFERQSLV